MKQMTRMVGTARCAVRTILQCRPLQEARGRRSAETLPESRSRVIFVAFMHLILDLGLNPRLLVRAASFALAK